MKKILPFLPLFTLVIGVLLVQGNQYNTSAILSSVLTGEKSPEITKICTKPEVFSEKDESAWCQYGLVSNIVEKDGNWSWKCLADNQRHPCHFAETKSYRAKILK